MEAVEAIFKLVARFYGFIVLSKGEDPVSNLQIDAAASAQAN
jgi:hypothetical protein